MIVCYISAAFLNGAAGHALKVLSYFEPYLASSIFDPSTGERAYYCTGRKTMTVLMCAC